MKTKFTKLIPILLSLTLFLNVWEVEGKSVLWNTAYRPGVILLRSAVNKTTTAYDDTVKTRGIGVPALASPNITVIYGFVMKDDNGNIINDSEIIPVGTKVNFVREESKTDISWFGSGYTLDSPYGNWTPNASYPSSPICSDDNLIIAFDHYYLGGLNSDLTNIYIPFSVHPPNISINHSGSATLNCINSGFECTVSSSGTIDSTVNITETYGKFYYAYDYYGIGSGCVSSSIPLWTCNVMLGKFGCPDASSAVVNVPAQTISFSLTAVSNNNPPLAPTITGVTSANLGSTNTFTFNATDPDGDTIAYQINWDNDNKNVVDGLSPTSGFVPSGSNSTSDYTLPSSGTTFTFKARTVDVNGGVSSWTTYTVTLLHAINGECGAADGTTLPSQPTIGLCIAPGTASSITTNATNWTWTCSGTNGGNPSPTCTTTKQGPTVNLWFSLFDRLKLFTGNLLSNSTLIDRVLAYDTMK